MPLQTPDPPTPQPPAGLASWFSLVSIPGRMQFELLAYAAGAFVLATAIERGARAAFPAAIPPEKGGLTGRRSAAALAARNRKEE